MNRHLRIPALSLLALFAVAIAAPSAQSAELYTAIGKVQKVEKEIVVIGGQQSKPLAFKLTGTSNITSLSVQTRSDKQVAVQRSVEASSLEAGQSIAVIYAVVDKENVILSAVVLPEDKKSETKTPGAGKPDLKKPILDIKPIPKK